MIYYFRAAAGPSIFGAAAYPTIQVSTIDSFPSKLTFKVVQDRERGSSQLHVQTADDDLMSDDDGVEPVEKVVVNNNIYP